MTPVEAATLRVIADSADSAAKLAVFGDGQGARSALLRAETRLAEFTRGKAWHERSVRLAREAVARAMLVVHGEQFGRGRRQRAVSRAVARAKT